MAMNLSTPPSMSPPTSPLKRRSPNLSIDLKDLPPLTQPSPPTNTLLITNLQAPEIFTAPNLESIQRAINDHATIHTFAPLRSFRRVVVSFYTTEAAIEIRKVLDGETVLGSRVRVYFGQETKINPEDQHLRAPKSDKLFFISPPPSPPMGWEMRDEEPPNKDVHAEDLAAALSRLKAKPGVEDLEPPSPQQQTSNQLSTSNIRRQRSGTGTIVYDPQDHGHSPDLPAIAVEDTSLESPTELSPMEGVETKITHTARPPVELME
ncbi:calcineurin binding protein-like protein [Polychaeton citri CBS 116435]|uniref:Calcineurin binding protein-like protein n=1 Tax=Polychaeton citri CBS 116435 TaxID=1314669 RepID=A0A9P4Q1Q6_9PEZI|nr:calcineurin binding protein-like protein [Polychaeton citri CBS 116435]